MIEPKILKGTRDFGPEEMAKRLYVINKIRNVFERYGYGTIETPVIEYAETILGKYGDEGDQLTYKFEDNGGRNIALRYDQTVPFARYYAANYGTLVSPFKRYQIGRVWRADKPQKGRYREFYQCDIDIIGTKSLLAEIEVLKVFADVYRELGINMDEVSMRINDRALMDSLMESANIPEELRLKVISAIDKLDKIGEEKVISILEEIGLNPDQVEEVKLLLNREGNNNEKLSRLEKYNTDTISKILKLAKESGLEDLINFDPSLARGLDYYTGLILEVEYQDAALGSIAAGGRYDNLCGSFCKQEFSGMGAALGFERIMIIMEEEGLLNNISPSSQVLVGLFDDAPETESYALKIYDQLHSDRIKAEIYFGAAKLKKQFKYADRKNIPYVILAGPDEMSANKLTLKNMLNGEQKELTLEELKSNI